MLGFIISVKTFEVIATVNVESYAFVHASTTDDKSEAVVSLARGDFPVLEDNWFTACVGSHWFVYLIDGASPARNTARLSLKDAAHIFDRLAVISREDKSSLGAFILSAAELNFIACEDEQYRLPYLNILNMDSSPVVLNIGEDGLYSLAATVLNARNQGLRFNWIPGRGSLLLEIMPPQKSEYTVLFNGGHSQLSSESYTRDQVSKVTALKDTEEPEVYERTDYYLGADGEMYLEPPEHRADGRWEYIICKLKDDPAEKALNLFAANINSHKIEFWHDAALPLGASVRTRLNGREYESTVTYVCSRSSDSRCHIKLGELSTTIAEKVRTATTTAKAAAAAAAATECPFPVGYVWISTSSIDPAVWYKGTTWQRMPGRMLLFAGDCDANTTNEFGKCSKGALARPAGEKGGAVNKTLTAKNLPPHSHSYSQTTVSSLYNRNVTTTGSYALAYGASSSSQSTGETGEGESFDILPPYVAVYGWQRTS